MAFARLETRIAALEGATSSNSEVDLQEHAKAFTDAIQRLADRFDDSRGNVRPCEQDHWSPAMRLAWAMRFGGPAECDAMLAEAKSMVAVA